LLAGSLLAMTLPAQNVAELKNLKFRSLGPMAGGRVDAVAGIPGRPNVYLFGAAAGGVFRTEDGGLTWKATFEHEAVASIGALAVAPSDPNVVWVGTGEANARGDVSYGNGVYRSTDGGKTWTYLGLDDTQTISQIAVDPRNPDVALVAAVGHIFGPNAERGVFRTTDGGKTWQKVLYKDDNTGASSVALDPQNPRIVYAGLWSVRRSPWNLTDGGSTGGLYRSTDGGSTWKELEGHGLPSGLLGKIGVTVAPSDSNRVYAMIETEKGLLWRSDDAGETWKMINASHAIDQRPWYYTYVIVDPRNPDVLYCPSVPLMKSIDGGLHFTAMDQRHGDNHALWIDPLNPQRMILGDDGGISISTNGGASWQVPALPITQFYHVNLDRQLPYTVCGEEQDLGSACGPSRTLGRGGVATSAWESVGGGESGFAVPDPADPDVVYAGGYEGSITRFDRRTKQVRPINPWPEEGIGSAAKDLKYRFQWTTPITVSPHDHHVVYVGANVLFKTTDGGETWTIISPDLTRDDQSKQQPSGGPISGDNTAVEYYDTIFAVAESPMVAGQIWVGTDDGLVQLTRDGGAHWANVTPKAMPTWCTVDTLEASSHAAGTAYAVVDCHKLGDNRPYVFATDDFGANWRALGAGLPSFVHVVREDRRNPNLLFLGTETGLFASFDRGTHWQSLQNTLPTAPVYDLALGTTSDDLVIATHGRSFWVLDDLAPLRQLAPGGEPAVHLFQPESAYRFRGFDRHSSDSPFTQNAPAGAVLDYWLKEKPKEPIKLTILDAQGRLVREFTSAKKDDKENKDEAKREEDAKDEPHGPELPVEPGLNRFVWDLRYAPPSALLKGVVLWSGGGREGPVAVPGAYSVRLEAAGERQEEPLEVRPDPKSPTAQATLEMQQAFLLRLRDDITWLATTGNRILALRTQLDGLQARIKDDATAGKLRASDQDLLDKLNAIDQQLEDRRFKEGEDVLRYPVRLYNRLSTLAGFVGESDGAPSAAAQEVAGELEKRLNQQVSAFDQLAKTAVPAINQLAAQAHLGVLR